jgi:hypothetical protein
MNQGISPQAPEKTLSQSIGSSNSTKSLLEKSSLPSKYVCLAADKAVLEKALKIIDYFSQGGIFPPLSSKDLDLLDSLCKGISLKSTVQVEILAQELDDDFDQPELPSSLKLNNGENTETDIKLKVKQDPMH